MVFCLSRFVSYAGTLLVTSTIIPNDDSGLVFVHVKTQETRLTEGGEYELNFLCQLHSTLYVCMVLPLQSGLRWSDGQVT